MIMRSKFKINYLNLVSCTCGSFLALIISHLWMISWSSLQLTNRSWDWNCLIMPFFNFDLMTDLLAAKTIMRLKFKKGKGILTSWSKCWPPDRHCQILMNKFDLMNKLNFDLMKKWILISWNSTSWSFPKKQQPTQYKCLKCLFSINIFHFVKKAS